MQFDQMSLEFRPLGEEQFAADRIVLGMAPSAGLYHRSISGGDVAELLRAAADSGIAAIDTAPLYGCGRSEIDVGRAFGETPALLQGATIATKVGRTIEPRAACREDDPRVEWGDQCYDTERETTASVAVGDYTAAGIQRSYEQSLERLGVAAACVATLRMHDAETDARVAEAIDGGGVAALVQLRTAGKVRRVGLGMNSPPHILRLLRAFPRGTFDNVLLAGCWNLIDRSGAEVLAVCAELGVEVHIAGVFGAGLLWGGDNYRYAAADDDTRARRDGIAALCATHGVPLPWLALHFATRPAVVSLAVLGCATAAELRGNAELLGATAGIASDALPKLYAECIAAGFLPANSVGQ
jgi:D-threo-aldose 1-dehydrogenase